MTSDQGTGPATHATGLKTAQNVNTTGGTCRRTRAAHGFAAHVDLLRSLEHHVLEHELGGSERLAPGPLVVLLYNSSAIDEEGLKGRAGDGARTGAFRASSPSDGWFAVLACNAEPSPGAPLPDEALFVP